MRKESHNQEQLDTNSSDARVTSIEECGIENGHIVLTGEHKPIVIMPQNKKFACMYQVADSAGNERVYAIIHDVFFKPNQIARRRTLLDRARSKHLAPTRILRTDNQALIAKIYETEGAEKSVASGGDVNHQHQAFKKIVMRAISQGASDIHILTNARENWCRVRFRVDGRLTTVDTPLRNHDEAQAVLRSIWNSVAERSSRHVVGGGSESEFSAKKVTKCRVDLNHPVLGIKGRWSMRWQTTVADGGGMKVSLRLIDADKLLSLGLDGIGMSETQVDYLQSAMGRGKGKTIIAGVTNSGKSTTLGLFLASEVTDNPGRSYISVEDPKEFDIPDVDSVVITRGSNTGSDEITELDRVQVLDNLLRQDPDMLYMGEFRSSESINLGITAAQSGHGVFGTLHADSALGCFQRMMHKVNDPALAPIIYGSDIINGTQYQRLVPKVCPDCCIPLSADKQLHGYMSRVIDDPDVLARIRIEGDDPDCPTCQGRGIKGVSLALEQYVPDRAVLQFMHDGQWTEAHQAWIERFPLPENGDPYKGVTIVDHILFKVTQGLCSPVEISHEAGRLKVWSRSEGPASWRRLQGERIIHTQKTKVESHEDHLTPIRRERLNA